MAAYADERDRLKALDGKSGLLLADNQRLGAAKGALAAAGSRLLLAGLLCVAVVPALVAALTGVLQ